MQPELPVMNWVLSALPNWVSTAALSLEAVFCMCLGLNRPQGTSKLHEEMATMFMVLSPVTLSLLSQPAQMAS